MMILNEYVRYGNSTIAIILMIIGCFLFAFACFRRKFFFAGLAVILAALFCSAAHTGAPVEKYFRVLLDEKYTYSQLAQDYCVMWVEDENVVIVKEK